MNARNPKAYIWDCQQAAERVIRLTTGRSFDDYMGDEILRPAVERQFEIMGKALATLRRFYPDLAATIPSLPRIVAFRNVLVHGYAIIDMRYSNSARPPPVIDA